MRRTSSLAMAMMLAGVSAFAAAPAAGGKMSTRAMYEVMHGKKKKPREPRAKQRGRHTATPGFNPRRRRRRMIERAWFGATGKRMSGRQWVRYPKEEQRMRNGPQHVRLLQHMFARRAVAQTPSGERAA